MHIVQQYWREPRAAFASGRRFHRFYYHYAIYMNIWAQVHLYKELWMMSRLSDSENTSSLAVMLIQWLQCFLKNWPRRWGARLHSDLPPSSEWQKAVKPRTAIGSHQWQPSTGSHRLYTMRSVTDFWQPIPRHLQIVKTEILPPSFSCTQRGIFHPNMVQNNKIKSLLSLCGFDVP